MNRKLLSLFIVFLSISAFSQTNVSITVSKSTMGENDSIDIIATLDAVTDQDVNIDFEFSGTAKADLDYSSDFFSKGSGATVAGGNGYGSSLNQLGTPNGVFVDLDGNIYVADGDNNRILKWAPGALEGIIVAGGNGEGSASNQMKRPTSVFVDLNGNIYVVEQMNNRVSKWVSGADEGITVAGGNGGGSAANQLNMPFDVFVDLDGNIYVSDDDNNRIQKWAPGADEGITVAGGNGEGSAANQFYDPMGLFVDLDGNIYVADWVNQRIQKWASGALEGITVAGGNGEGSAANQFHYPSDVFVDLEGNIFVADFMNYRIQKWTAEASEGITVAGGNGQGSDSDQIQTAHGVYVDLDGNIYVADRDNRRVQRFQYAPQIVISAGETVGKLTINGIEDELDDEINETIIVDIKSVSNANVVGDQQQVITILADGGSSNSSTLNGKVTNALDGTAIAGALVEIETYSTTTDSEGNYELADIPAAELNAAFSGTPLSGTAPLEVSFTDQSNAAAYSLVVSATGFSTYTNNQVVISAGETLTMDVSLSPTLSSGETRIVLNWGSSPSDIDSYLKTPSINGSEYTIYFSSKGSSTSAPYVTLDHDDRDGYGPETITIYQMSTGTYKYYVHNYSESPDIVTSSAVVQVYSDAGLIKSVNIPSSGSGLYWNVLTIDGSTGNISVINEIVSSTPTAAAPSIPSKSSNFKQIEILKKGMESISNWSWDFGDGNTSTDQNPTHTYTEGGVYTVSLTVSNGTDSKTETKTNYINVTASTGWDAQNVVIYDGDEADIMVRTGDIDNLGFGWPTGFDPFSGANTPAHSFPWSIDPTDARATDRIMVVSSYNGNPPSGSDGYTSSTSRPTNNPDTLKLSFDLQSRTIESAIFQIFVDDFQASSWGANYTVKLDGDNYPFMAEIINSLSQTGPIGKLISVPVTGDLLSNLNDGVVELFIDDATTGAGDGFAIDFVKLLINAKTFTNTGTISGTVLADADGTPIPDAEVWANNLISVSTNAAGEFTLDNIVSGLVFVKVNAAGYHSKSIIVDLENTETETVAFRLEKIEAVLEENFDGTVFPPTGWTQTITNTANTWIQDNLTESFSDIDATNVYSALCPWVDEDQDEWLKSPAFSLSDGLYSLEFYAGFDPYWLSSATLKLNISTDGGTNWTKIWEANNDGQEWVWRLITLDLSSYANNANVMLGWQYVGNNGDWVGIDNVSLVSGTTGLIEQEFEKEYSLAQNYPNPFTDQTTISFQLDDPKHINLTIYNSIGQKIAEPFNEKLNSGKHQYIFDATGLKAGIYYYRLTIDGQGSAIPMILSK